MSLTPGTTLGLYEILAPIGAGGMGEVYKARDSKLGREVAVKVLSRILARDPEGAQHTPVVAESTDMAMARALVASMGGMIDGPNPIPGGLEVKFSLAFARPYALLSPIFHLSPT